MRLFEMTNTKTTELSIPFNSFIEYLKQAENVQHKNQVLQPFKHSQSDRSEMVAV